MDPRERKSKGRNSSTIMGDALDEPESRPLNYNNNNSNANFTSSTISSTTPKNNNDAIDLFGGKKRKNPISHIFKPRKYSFTQNNRTREDVPIAINLEAEDGRSGLRTSTATTVLKLLKGSGGGGSKGTYEKLSLIGFSEPVIRLLRWFGFFPLALTKDAYLDTGQLKIRRHTTIGWIVYSLFTFILVSAVFAFNCKIMHITGSYLGILHVDTMAFILTGLKPLHAALNLAVFLLGVRQHRTLLESMQVVNRSFLLNFNQGPIGSVGHKSIIYPTAGIAAFAFLTMVAQYFLTGNIPGQFWFADVSVILVPVLAVWQLLPLFYFIYINRLIRYWFRYLKRFLLKDLKLEAFDMDFYYNQYLNIAKACRSMDALFNSFIFLSLAMSVAILCLTIYFITNAEEILKLQTNATTVQKARTYFLPAWAGLQVLTAIIYFIAIVMAGMWTNEEGRSILNVVLAVMPRDETSRFRMISFSNKIQMQYTWGVTVWRAFPVERSLLFTLFSGIVTYAVILLRMQQTHGIRKCNGPAGGPSSAAAAATLNENVAAVTELIERYVQQKLASLNLTVDHRDTAGQIYKTIDEMITTKHPDL